MKRKKLRLTPKQAEHMLFNVLEIGSRMLVSGAEVQRVENSIYRMCTAYGSETTEVFCMTYMIVVTISSKQFGTITLSRRIHNLSLNLYELLYLNALSRRMCSTLPDMKTVDQKIRQIKALPKYGPIPSMLIYALISSSFTIFFGGSLPDAAVSGMIGIGYTVCRTSPSTTASKPFSSGCIIVNSIGLYGRILCLYKRYVFSG